MGAILPVVIFRMENRHVEMEQHSDLSLSPILLDLVWLDDVGERYSDVRESFSLQENALG